MGRLLAQASPGPGERIVVAPIDISALRHERAIRRGHHMLAHLRTEAYPVYRQHQYPPNIPDDGVGDYERNNLLIDEAKGKLDEFSRISRGRARLSNDGGQILINDHVQSPT